MISPIHLSQRPHHIPWFPSLQLKQKDVAAVTELLLWATQQPQHGRENPPGQHSTKLSCGIQEDPGVCSQSLFHEGSANRASNSPLASVWATRTASKSNSPTAQLFDFMISKNIIRGSRSSVFISPPSFKRISVRWVQQTTWICLTWLLTHTL